VEPAPTILAYTYVVAYAHVDDSVQFEQRRTLNVDGQWLGRVPCLAICEELSTGEFIVQYCTEAWEPLGVAAGYKSAVEAMDSVAHSYHGIESKWITNHINRSEGLAIYEEQLKAESCSFCGRTVLEVTSMVGETPRICNHCIRKFHAALHDEQGKI
jgi:hypothetical protein